MLSNGLAFNNRHGLFLAGSVPSLAAGLVFGSVLGYGSYQTSRDPQNFHLALGTSALLGGIMGVRFYNSGKLMPAGVITALRYITFGCVRLNREVTMINGKALRFSECSRPSNNFKL
ncbi:hypothetical protein AAG570_007134 [Ranatra chinensis]|uniref:Transmembrane protein 14C n=1 Tax=Ranatra chinensis TaxID=642074 RepID=A0ABD0XVA5_9HEMI